MPIRRHPSAAHFSGLHGFRGFVIIHFLPRSFFYFLRVFIFRHQSFAAARPACDLRAVIHALCLRAALTWLQTREGAERKEPRTPGREFRQLSVSGRRAVAVAGIRR